MGLIHVRTCLGGLGLGDALRNYNLDGSECNAEAGCPRSCKEVHRNKNRS